MMLSSSLSRNSLGLFFAALIITSAFLASGCKGKKDMVEETVVEETEPAPVVLEERQEEIVEVKAWESADSVLFSLRRTACFGTCPIFKFVIYGDLSATYHGDNFVDRMGDYEGLVDLSMLLKLQAAANDVGYFDFEDEYDDKMVTDLPSAITELRSEEGMLKRVKNRYQGPPQIRDFYAVAEAIMEEIEWKPIDNNK